MIIVSPRAGRLVTVLAIVLPVLLLPPRAANAAAGVSAPPPEPVVVDIVTVAGTGCSPGTTSISVLSDNAGFQLNYGDFQAEAGGGAPTIDARKFCTLNLQVHAPEGYTYAIAGSRFHGYAHVEPGATAVLRSQHYFGVGVPVPYSYHSFAGPFDGDWSAVDVIDPAEQVFAPCGETRLTVTTQLRVVADTATELASRISLQASTPLYQLEWREC